MKKIAVVFSIFVVLASLGSAFLILTGRVSWESNNKNYAITFNFENMLKASRTYEIDLQNLGNELKVRGGSYVVFEARPTPGGLEDWELPGYLNELKQAGFKLGLELDPTFLKRLSTEELETFLAAVEGKGIELFVNDFRAAPAGAERKILSNWIRDNEIVSGPVEFRDNSIASELANEGYSRISRYHRLFQGEISAADLQYLINRLVRAVKERNIGLVEFKFLTSSGLEDNLSAIGGLDQELRNIGYTNVASSEGRNPKGIEKEFSPSGWLLLPLIYLSVLAWIYLIRNLFERDVNRSLFILGVFGIVVGTFGFFYFPELTRQFAAFLFALGGPGFAYLGIESLWDKKRQSGSYFALSRSLLLTVVATSISTFFGILLSAALSDYQFLLKLEQFRGVKVSLVFPLLFVIALAFAKRDLSLSQMKVRPLHLFLLAVTGLFFVFILLRSGNFSFMPIAEFETYLRSWLGESLFVRPRFKEFIIGYPSLVLLLYLTIKDRGPLYRMLLLPLAFLGQVSIINTFAHIHTPLVISLMRTFNGLWLGLIFGFLITLAYLLIYRVLGIYEG